MEQSYYLRLDAKCVYYLPRSSDGTEPGTQHQLSDVKTTYDSSSVSTLPKDFENHTTHMRESTSSTLRDLHMNINLYDLL